MSEQTLPCSAFAEDSDPAATLKRVGAAVLETMFFDEAVATRCDHGWIASAPSVRLTIAGSYCGEFLLSVSPEVARSIAPAFLGIDPEEISDSQKSQVLLELANILCGSVLSQLQPDSDLMLGAPEPIELDEPVHEALHQCFLLPEGMLSVSIRMCGAD